MHLAVVFANNLCWKQCIHNITLKTCQKLNVVIPLKFRLDRKSLEVIYTYFVLSSMEYAMSIWTSYDSDILKLERIHVDAMQLVLDAAVQFNIAKLYKELS